MSSSSTTSNLSLGVLLLGLILATAQTPSQSTSATQTSQTDTSEKEKSAPKPTDMSIEDYAAEQIQPKDAQDAERLIKEEEETEKFTEAVNGGDAVLDGPKPALIIVMVSSDDLYLKNRLRLLTRRYPVWHCRAQHHGEFANFTGWECSDISIDVFLCANSGKSTVGMSLGNALSLPFIDGDSLHPKSNVEKMTAGHPLDDSDRLPWLALIRSTAERVCREEWVKEGRDEYGVDGGDIASMAEWEFGEGWKWMHAGEGEKAGNGMVKRGLGRPAVIIACSALKKWYRDILRGTVRVELPETKEEDSDEVC